jgi:hypothetical protein
MRWRRHSGPRVTLGAPPASPAPFAIWGQEWLALRVLPDALAASQAVLAPR